MSLSNCLLEHATEGKVEGLADEEEYVKSYCNVTVKEEALDLTV
jgi:hypothetical protein